MFDRHGDILKCEQLDGPVTDDGDELILVEERKLHRKGGGAPSTGPGKLPTLPGGDSIEPAVSVPSGEEIDPSREREPIVA
jgi:hypothetical protein